MYDDISSDGVFPNEWVQCTQDKCKFWIMKNAQLMMVNIFVFVEKYLNKLLWLWS